jgi:hypothetical protein
MKSPCSVHVYPLLTPEQSHPPYKNLVQTAEKTLPPPGPPLLAYFPCLSICVSPLLLLHNSSVNMFPQQQIHMQQLNCWIHHLLCSPCLIKGKEVIRSSQNFLLFIHSCGEAFKMSQDRAQTAFAYDSHYF